MAQSRVGTVHARRSAGGRCRGCSSGSTSPSCSSPTATQPLARERAACRHARLPAWQFDAAAAARALAKHFGTRDLAAFGVEDRDLGLGAAGALLGYAAATQQSALAHVRALAVETASEFLALDAATRRNLEITETLRGEPAPTLLSLLDTCGTAAGSRLLRHWLTHPLRSQADAAARHAAVAVWIDERAARAALARELARTADVERIAARIALASARPRDLAGSARHARAPAGDRSPRWRRCDVPLVASLAQALAIDPQWADLLTRAIAPEPAAQVRDGGVIATGFDAELDELRAIDDTAASSCSRWRRASARAPASPISRSSTTACTASTSRSRMRTCRRSPTTTGGGRRSRMPSATSRRSSRRSRTARSRRRSARSRARSCSTSGSSRISRRRFPALQSWGRRSRRSTCWRPSPSAPRRSISRVRTSSPRPGSRFAAAGIRSSSGRSTRSSRTISTSTPERRLLVVTGPNMGGKSTYMRQAAVIALLAYCGSFVPARAAAIGPLDAIHTRIGAADDLAGGRSTFMVEMTEAAAILHRATPQSLVLIDEIGRGTSTFDGLALAWAIARELAEKNRSLALFATHYFELTALPAEIDGCANLHFDAVEHADGIVFLHAAEDGPANRSYGLQVAKLAGVPSRRGPPRAGLSGAARQVQRGGWTAARPVRADRRRRRSPPMHRSEPRSRHSDADRRDERSTRSPRCLHA